MKRWKVWCPERGQQADDGYVVEAFDPKLAACSWAERDDWISAEYSIASGKSEPEVCVQPADGGPITRLKVSGEARPVYYARVD